MKKRWMVKSVTLLVALSFVLASVCAVLSASADEFAKISSEATNEQTSDTPFQTENGMIVNIKAGTKVYYLTDLFEELCCVKDQNGKEVSANVLVATGYTFVNLATSETMQIVVNGDINGDARVNGVDIIRAKKYLANTPEYSCYLEALDCNRDGEYTTADIDMLFSMVAEGQDEMPDTDADIPFDQRKPINLGTDFYARIMGASSRKYVGLSGDNVVINTVENSRSQQWHFKLNSDGAYTITNRSTGKALDVYAAGTANGSNVQTYESNNTDAQRWFVHYIDGQFVLESKNAPSKTLDVASNGTADGSNVQIYQYSGSAAQKYSLVKITEDEYTENTVWYATKSITVEAGKVCDLNRFNVQFANNAHITDGINITWTSNDIAVNSDNVITPEKGTYKITAKNGLNALTVTVRVVEANEPVLYQLCPNSEMLGNSYVIKTKNDKLIVIDGGGKHYNEMGFLYEELQRISGKEVPEVEAWFLSHPHDDHMTEFTYLVNKTSNEIVIKNVYLNFPSKSFMSSSENGMYRFVYDDVKSAYDKLFGNGSFDAINGKNAFEGDVITVDGVKFEILTTVTNAESETNINDTSMIFRATIEGQTVLFLGDAYINEGDRLLSKYGNALKSDVVQMSHHGQQGIRKEVYQKINPSVCLWPSADWVYENHSGTLQTFNDRTWMSDMGVKYHLITGLYMTQSLYFPIDYSALPVIDPAP